MDAKDIALMKSIAAGAVPEAVHINLGDYVDDLLLQLYSQLIAGNVEFSLPINNGSDLFRSINKACGNVFLDIHMENDVVLSSNIISFNTKTNGEIFFASLQLMGYNTNGWIILYISINNANMYVKVVQFSGL